MPQMKQTAHFIDGCHTNLHGFHFHILFDPLWLTLNLAATLILGRFCVSKILLPVQRNWYQCCVAIARLYGIPKTCKISPNGITIAKKSYANTITCHTNKPTAEPFHMRHRVESTWIMIAYKVRFCYVFIS